MLFYFKKNLLEKIRISILIFIEVFEFFKVICRVDIVVIYIKKIREIRRFC